MGLYDTFIVPGARCPKCKHRYDADFQTKAFGSLMDTIKVGEDVRATKPLWWLHKDNIFDKKFTLEEAKRIVTQNPKKFKLSTSTFKDGFKYVRVDQYLGNRPPNFSNVKDAEFEMHDICPKCKEFYSVTGIIRHWKFIGIKPQRGRYKRTLIVTKRS